LRNVLKKNIENSKSLTVENRRVLLSKLNDAGTRKLFEKKTMAFDKERKSVMDKIEKSKYLSDDQKKFLSTLGNISEVQKRFEVLEGKLKSIAAFENFKTRAKKQITKMKINTREYLKQIHLSRTKNQVSEVIQEAKNRAAFEKKAREFENLKTKAKKKITNMQINSREYLQQINSSRTKNEVSKVIQEAKKRAVFEKFKEKQKAQVSALKMLPKNNKGNYLKNIDGATSERQVEAAVKAARNKEESLRKVAKSQVEKSKVKNEYENALSDLA